MGYWNWINGVYNFEQAIDKIDELNKEVSKLRCRVREADQVILDLMSQHIGMNSHNQWNMSYMSSDENAIRYEEENQLLAKDTLGDICD